VVVIVSGAAEEQEACTVVELDPREFIPGYCQFECSQQYQGTGYCVNDGPAGKCYCKFNCNILPNLK
jgi:hypothetical protein